MKRWIPPPQGLARKATMVGSGLFRKIEHLGILSLYGNIIKTSSEAIHKIKYIFEPSFKDMVANESTEFIEGFLAGALYGAKFIYLGGGVTEEAAGVPKKQREHVRNVQIDTVLTLLAEYLMEQRRRQ